MTSGNFHEPVSPSLASLSVDDLSKQNLLLKVELRQKTKDFEINAKKLHSETQRTNLLRREIAELNEKHKKAIEALQTSKHEQEIQVITLSNRITEVQNQSQQKSLEHYEQLSGLQFQNDSLQENITQVTKENTSLKSQIASLTAQVTSLESVVTEKDKTFDFEISSLKALIETQNAEKEQQNHKLSELQSKLLTYEDEKRDISEKLSKVSSDYSEAQIKVSNFDKMIEENNQLQSKKFQDLETVYNDLHSQSRQEISRLQSELDLISRENSNLHEKLSSQSSQYLALQQTLVAQKSTLTNKITELEEELSSYKESLDVIEQEGVVELTSRLEETMSCADVIKNDLETITFEKELVDNELAQMRMDYDDLESKYTTLQTKYSDEIYELTSKLSLSEESASISRKNYENSEAAFMVISQQLKDTVADFESVISEKDSNISKLNLVIDGLKLELTKLSSKIKNIIKEKEESLLAKDDIIESISREANQLSEKVNELTSLLDNQLTCFDSFKHEKNREENDLKQLNKDLENENDQLKMKLETLKIAAISEQSEFLQKISTLSYEVQELQETKKSLEVKVEESLNSKSSFEDNLVSRITELTNENEQLSNENEMIKNQNQSNLSTIDKLNDTLSRLQVSSTQEQSILHDEILTLSSKIQELEESLRISNDQKNLPDENNQSRDKVDISELHLSSISDLENEISQLKSQILTLNSDHESFITSLKESHNQSILDLNQRLSTVNSDLHSAQSEIQRLSDCLTTLDAEKSKLETNYISVLAQTKEAISLAYQEFYYANFDSENFDEILSKFLTDYEVQNLNHLETLHNECVSMIEIASSLRKERDNLIEQKSKLTEEVQRLSSSLLKKSSVLDEISIQKQQLEALVSSLTKKIELLNVSNSDEKINVEQNFGSKLQAINQENDVIISQNRELIEQLESAQKARDSNQKKIDELMNSLNEAQNEYLLLKHETLSIQQNLELKIVELEGDLAVSREELQRVTTSSKEKIKELSFKVSDLSNQLSHKISDFNSLQQNMSTNSTNLQSKLNQALNQNSKLTGDSRARNESFQNEIRQLKTILAQKDEEISGLLSKLDDQSSTITRLESLNISTENYNIEILELKSQIGNLKQKFNDTVKELETVNSLALKLKTTNQEVGGQNKELNQRLVELTNQIKNSPSISVTIHNEQLNSLKSSINLLQSQLSETQNQRFILQEQNLKLTQELAKTKTYDSVKVHELTVEIENLEQILREKDLRIRALGDRLSVSSPSSEVSRLRQTIFELESLLAEKEKECAKISAQNFGHKNELSLLQQQMKTLRSEGSELSTTFQDLNNQLRNVLKESQAKDEILRQKNRTVGELEKQVELLKNRNDLLVEQLEDLDSALKRHSDILNKRH
ncbi:hypothetical protein RCL1_005456 [Eukaryota sp. TZLM3-RCL]